MNRNIKFRIWKKNPTEEGYFKTIPEKHVGKICAHVCISTEQDIFCKYILEPTGDRVFQQFTGFFDKNGNEIYEGDILKFDKQLNVVVAWGYKGGWMLSDGCNWTDTFLADDLNLKIIGNIFENPELLK